MYINNIKIKTSPLVYPPFEINEIFNGVVLGYIFEQFNEVQEKMSVLDLCCGTGIGGIAIKKNTLINHVDCADISSEAISLTIENAILNDCEVNTYISDLFSNIPQHKYSIIESIYPCYSSNDYDALCHNAEPRNAYDAGDDAYKFPKAIRDNLDDYLELDGKLFLFCLDSRCLKEIQKIYQDYEIIVQEFPRIKQENEPYYVLTIFRKNI